MIVLIFPVMAACGVFLAYSLKIHLSGCNLSYTKLYFCLLLNDFFVVPYINIIQHDDFPYLGHRPDIISEHPFIGWIAFVCVFLHLFSLPVKRNVKGWLSRK